MKVRIDKFQKGGGFATFTPIIHSAPRTSTRSTQVDTDNSEKTPTSILDDEVFKELLRNGGLDNDINELVNQLIDLEKSQGGLPYTSSDNRTLALRMIGKVNQLRNSKAEWIKAMSTAESSGGLSEVAVSSNGLMFTRDEKGLVGTMSTKEFAKSKGKFRALTVSELLSERRYNPTMVGREDIFDVAKNSTGMEKIKDDVRSIIAALGEESIEEVRFLTKSQIAKRMENTTGIRPTQSELAGIQDLNKVTSKSSSERNHAEAALNYIWRTLDPHKQQKLTAVAALNGEMDPTKLIQQMIISQTNYDVSEHIVPASEAAGGGSGGSTTGMKSLTNFQMLHKDKLMSPRSTFTFNDPKLGVLFRGSIAGISPVITANGESVPMTTLQNILTNVGYNQFLESDKVYFGDKHVALEEFNNIIYNGQDGAKVYMPVDNNGAPDYKEFAKFKEIYAVYESNKDHWTAQYAMDFFKSHNYNLQIDERYEDGEKVKFIRDNAKIKPFWVMSAFTNDATTLVKDNAFITPLTSDEEKVWKPRLESIWTIKDGKDKINNTPNKRFNREDYYQGLVAIPYRPGAGAIVDAMVKQGPLEKPQTIGVVQTNNLYSNQPVINSTSAAVFKQ